MSVSGEFNNNNISIELQNFANSQKPNDQKPQTGGFRGISVQDITKKTGDPKLEIKDMNPPGGLLKTAQKTALFSKIILGAGAVGLLAAAPIAIIGGPAGIFLYGLFAATYGGYLNYSIVEKWDEIGSGPHSKDPAQDIIDTFQSKESYAEMVHDPLIKGAVGQLKESNNDSKLYQLDTVYRKLEEYNKKAENERKVDLKKFPDAWDRFNLGTWTFSDDPDLPQEQQQDLKLYWQLFQNLKIGDKKSFGFE